MLKQAKVRTKLGGFQVQLSTSMSHYIVYMNLSFVGMMFWYTTAGPALRPYLPWITFWMFASIILIIIVTVMIMDYKFMYPSRQGFLNKQMYKHENPIVRDVKQIQKDIEKIKEKLDIVDD